MIINFKRTSNKRCSKYYLLKCFDEMRECSPTLECEKEVFRKFLDKKKVEVVMTYPLLANYVEVKCLIEYIISFYGHILSGG